MTPYEVAGRELSYNSSINSRVAALQSSTAVARTGNTGEDPGSAVTGFGCRILVHLAVRV